jgi:hypothetical protein
MYKDADPGNGSKGRELATPPTVRVWVSTNLLTGDTVALTSILTRSSTPDALFFSTNARAKKLRVNIFFKLKILRLSCIPMPLSGTSLKTFAVTYPTPPGHRVPKGIFITGFTHNFNTSN